MEIIEAIKVIILAIVEGITEWLPISSTGHLILVDEFIKLNESAEFKELFMYVIQLGAILAVVVLFWDKMWPFQSKDKSKPVIKRDVFSMWFKVVVACIPGFLAYIALDAIFVDDCRIIAAALIVYGVAFIIIENWNKNRTPRVATLEEISYKDALLIGLFQALSIVPGTSRSGSTIIGGLIIGVSRVAAAEFTEVRLRLHLRTGDSARPRLRRCIHRVHPRYQIPYELHKEEGLQGVRLVPNSPRTCGPALLLHYKVKQKMHRSNERCIFLCVCYLTV